MPRDTQYGVFEVGMNHFGELRNLVSFVRPHVALVTTIAPAHLEFFGNCEAIADAKSEIFEGILPGGTALIPADSDYAARLTARARQTGVSRVMSFGSNGSDARLIGFSEAAEGMKVQSEILGRRVDFRVGAPGAHIAGNAVGALLAVAVLEGDVLNAAAALSQFSALKGRGARFKIAAGKGSAVVIDESYNANPASMRAALALLGSTDAGRRIAVPGGRRRARRRQHDRQPGCGDERREQHPRGRCRATGRSSGGTLLHVPPSSRVPRAGWGEYVHGG